MSELWGSDDCSYSYSGGFSMKDGMKGIGALILLILGVVFFVDLFVFAATGSDLFMYKFFAPKFENARRETFEQSKSFKQGLAQELDNLHEEYMLKADAEQKKAIADIVMRRVADVNLDTLPLDLSIWVQKLKLDRAAKAEESYFDGVN